MKKELLILQSSQDRLFDVASFEAASNGFEVTGVVSNYQDALLLLEKLPIAGVIIELKEISSELNEFILKLSKASSRLVVCVVTTIQDNNLLAGIRQLGADAIFHIPFSNDTLAAELEHWINYKKRLSSPISVKLPPKDRSVDERIANIFIASGIPPHIKGYQFLREAIKLSVSNPSMINNITKQLYPNVALKFDTSASKVERAIRHAIDVAWARGKIENINSIYGIKVFAKGERPTNGELIALISDKIMIEGSC